LAAPPSPEHLADGTLDDGAIEIVGFDVEPDATVAGKPVEVAVYFRVVRRPSAAFKLQVEARPARPPAGAPRVASSALRSAGQGVLPTSRWRPGEFVRERFKVRIPAAWAAAGAAPGPLALSVELAPDRRPDGRSSK